MPADTHTELYPGLGGSKMDESLVTTGAGSVHRARVVPGGDDGALQSFVTEDSTTKAHVKDASAVAALAAILAELEAPTGLTAAQLSVHLNTLGQKLSNASAPVVLASDHPPIAVDVGANLSVTASFDDLVSVGNSYDGLLAPDEVFTGAWEETSGFAAIIAALSTDQYSAINGAVAQFSDDGVNVLAYSASTMAPVPGGAVFNFAPAAAYFRVIYQNGAVAANVRSHIVYKFNAPAVTQMALGAAITDLNNAQITRACATGRLATGQWTSIEATALGEMLVAGPVTDAQIRATPLPVSGTVAVTGTQSDAITDAQIRATPLPVSGTVDPSDRVARQVGHVRDRFTGGEVLADQAGAGAALTFTFAGGAVDLVWVRCDGGDGRADPFGGTPTALAGIICEDATPNPITMTATTIKVFASSGTSVSVWGFRY